MNTVCLLTVEQLIAIGNERGVKYSSQLIKKLKLLVKHTTIVMIFVIRFLYSFYCEFFDDKSRKNEEV